MNHKERKKLRRKLEQELAGLRGSAYLTNADRERIFDLRKMLGEITSYEVIAAVHFNYATGERIELV